MTSYISSDLRRLVIERAAGRCEYCRIRESDTFYGCQIDHIIAEKHHGATIESNLALTCAYAIDTREQISVRLRSPPVNLSDSITRELIIGSNTFDS
jgi:hypothetical protein